MSYQKIKGVMADGTTSRYIQVDGEGRLVVRKHNNTVHYYLDTATVISWTIYPRTPYRLVSLDIHASATLDTTEVLTVTKDAGMDTSFDTVLLSDDLYIGTRTSEHYVFGEGYEFATDDKLVVAQLNGSGDTIGIDVVIEVL